MNIVNYLLTSIVAWMAWIIIPFLMEILPVCFGFIILLKKKIRKSKLHQEIKYLPEISLIIPVYNSEDSLKGCIQSVHDSNYPNELINVLLVNNESKDGSFQIFTECQKQYKELNMV